MDEVEMQKLLDQKFKTVQDELRALQADGATKEELEKAINAIKAQGQALEDFIEDQNKKRMMSYEEKLETFLVENKAKIEEIYKSGSGEIIFNPFATKAPEDVTTSSGVNINQPHNSVVAQLGSFNLRNDNDILSLCTVSNTSSPSYAYTEMIPKDGDYAFVAEGGVKPKIDFKWETRFARPKKIAAYEVLTEEAVTDYVRLVSIAKEYLKKKHDLFKVSKSIFGTGIGEEAQGVTLVARTFVAGGMADKLIDAQTKFMDIVNAVITDIYTTVNFVDEDNSMPNLVLISPLDFFLEFQSAKDENGLPLYPQASLFNSVSIGGVTIRPWVKIPAGKIFVADMKKYHIINYIPFSIRIGWINDQFITNKFTMLGESRYFQFVKNLDMSSFVYDDIATVKAAISAPAA